MMEVLFVFIALSSAVPASGDFNLADACSAESIFVTVANFKEVNKKKELIKKEPIKVKLACNKAKTKIESCNVPREGIKLLADSEEKNEINAVGRLIFGDEDIPITNGKVYALWCDDTKEPTITVLDFANEICSKSDRKRCAKKILVGRNLFSFCFSCNGMKITSCWSEDELLGMKETTVGKSANVNLSVRGWCKVTCNAWEKPISVCEH